MKSVGPANPSSERVIRQLKTSILELSILEVNWLTSHKALYTYAYAATGDNKPTIGQREINNFAMYYVSRSHDIFFLHFDITQRI